MSRKIVFQVYVDGAIPLGMEIAGRRPTKQMRAWLDKNRPGWQIARYTFIRACDGQACDGTLYA